MLIVDAQVHIWGRGLPTNPLSKTCRLTGIACPFLETPRACPDSTFVAKVSMPPDEFNGVLKAHARVEARVDGSA